MRIMSKSPSRYPFNLQVKLNANALARNATILFFHSYKIKDNILKQNSTASFMYFLIIVTDSPNVIYSYSSVIK